MNKYKEREHCDKLEAAKGFFSVNYNLCADKFVKDFVKKTLKNWKQKIQSSYKLTSVSTGLGAAGRAVQSAKSIQVFKLKERDIWLSYLKSRFL